ncbi:hypothetical protein TWF102_011978 [Orbilia oligospora]|uniref:Uncharacterized protein n=1 Tax=Orbilia oligospora TaxID=2813651 RepID=A0A7C8N914_ORBOL|nr:hypothetical protein TWF103_002694 [Orbilia oligospora]KAF3084335.1 hypothetical protein TWF102_011978 [Orbilia oligospora]
MTHSFRKSVCTMPGSSNLLLLCTKRIRKTKASTRKEKGGQSTLTLTLTINPFFLSPVPRATSSALLALFSTEQEISSKKGCRHEKGPSCTDSSNPVRPCGKASEVSWGLPHHEARTNIAYCKKNRKFASRDAFML